MWSRPGRGAAARVFSATLLSAAGIAVTSDGRAQAAEPPHVTYHPDLRAFSRPLPAKTPFIIDIPIGAEPFDEVELTYWKASSANGCAAPASGQDEPRRLGARQQLDRGKGRFEIAIQPLAYSTDYCFQVRLSRALNEADRAHLARLLDELVEEALGEGGLLGPGMDGKIEEIFASKSHYTTADGAKRLPEAIKEWVRRSDIQAQLVRLSEAKKSWADAIASARSACDESGELGVIPALQRIDDAVKRFNEQLEALEEAFGAEIGRLGLTAVRYESTPRPTYSERAGLYVSGDVGLMLPYFAAAGEIGVSPLFGVNFYCGPVDKDEPLGWPDFWKRFAFTGGIALNVRDSARTTRPLIGDTTPFVGLGLRITDYLRVGTGLAFVLQADPNPLVSRERVRVANYFSASVDVDVAGTIKGLYMRGRSAL